ncbi:MAG TPA: hypothetical protein VEF72_15265 [Mycobacterium sp.]|nr:hypothetical protein [Mycobacterium sp.]
MGKGDLVAHSFELVDGALFGSFVVESVEVVGTVAECAAAIAPDAFKVELLSMPARLVFDLARHFAAHGQHRVVFLAELTRWLDTSEESSHRLALGSRAASFVAPQQR